MPGLGTCPKKIHITQVLGISLVITNTYQYFGDVKEIPQNVGHFATPVSGGFVWKWLVPHCTQWFCWSLSRHEKWLAIIGNIPYYYPNISQLYSQYKPLLLVLLIIIPIIKWQTQHFQVQTLVILVMSWDMPCEDLPGGARKWHPGIPGIPRDPQVCFVPRTSDCAPKECAGEKFSWKPYVWANYNNSLTWIVRPFGDDFPY